jgi:hypothetical protein
MEAQNQDDADFAKFNLAQRKLTLESKVRNGTNWFFWIGGLSIVNTLVYFFGGTFTFVIGLGATQFVDGFMSALAQDLGPGWNVARLLGLVIDICISGVFFLFGYLGRQRRPWAVIIGIVLYALDGVLLLTFLDFIGAGFHLIALLSIAKSIKAINDLAVLERYSSGNINESMFSPISSPKANQSMFSPSSSTRPGEMKIPGVGASQYNQTNQKEVTSNWIMIAMIIMIVILIIVIGVLLTQ